MNPYSLPKTSNKPKSGIYFLKHQGTIVYTQAFLNWYDR